MCTLGGWFMGISRGCVFESQSCISLFNNILVDQTRTARLADFGLLMICSDLTTSSSYGQAGSSRWMSPELFEPERFGVKDSRRTKYSDCYALGMVVYEVLSGQVPFSRHHKYLAVKKVLEGERPGPPQGVGGKLFTDDIWSVLGCCWEPIPENRPSVEDVLRHLEEASSLWTPPPPPEATPPPADSPPWSLSDLSTEGSLGGTRLVSSKRITPSQDASVKKSRRR